MTRSMTVASAVKILASADLAVAAMAKAETPKVTEATNPILEISLAWDGLPAPSAFPTRARTAKWRERGIAYSKPEIWIMTPIAAMLSSEPSLTRLHRKSVMLYHHHHHSEQIERQLGNAGARSSHKSWKTNRKFMPWLCSQGFTGALDANM